MRAAIVEVRAIEFRANYQEMVDAWPAT